MLRVPSLLLALAALGLVAPAAEGAAYLPPAGKVFHGATGGYSGVFIRLLRLRPRSALELRRQLGSSRFAVPAAL
jgi:hypothetical protein